MENYEKKLNKYRTIFFFKLNILLIWTFKIKFFDNLNNSTLLTTTENIYIRVINYFIHNINI